MHLEQILKNLPLGVGTPYQKTGLNMYLCTCYGHILSSQLIEQFHKPHVRIQEILYRNLPPIQLAPLISFHSICVTQFT